MNLSDGVEDKALCSLAILVHVIVNQKYVAHFAMVVYFVASIALPMLGFEHNLYRFNRAPGPRVTGVKADVDIFPGERRVEIRGRYAIKNRTAGPIDKVAVTLPLRARVKRLSFGRGEALADGDAALGFRVFRLGAPLAAGEEGALEFELSYESPGFESDGSDTQLVENGTFFNSTYLPVLAYRREAEVAEDDVRRRHGLPPRERMADLDDVAARMNNYVDRVIRGVKASLDYFTANFGPYQHRQVRIIEFPRYETFAGELGAESEAALEDAIDIGVLDAKGEPLWLERRRVDRAEMEWTVVVDEAPAKAGIDPLNKLIDRTPEDNVAAVEPR